MDNQQIYITNSTVKYPFDDQHTYDVANDIVLDMSLSVPSTVLPVVTVISITDSVFFMAVEDSISKDALGHFIISNPKAFKIYPMETTMDGCFGWIVLGPGRNRTYENRTLELGLDPTVVLFQPTPSTYMEDLHVDGIPYKGIAGELAMLSINPYIIMTIENRSITGLPGETGPVTKKCLVFKRDDSKFSSSLLYGGLTEAGAATMTPATSLGGVYPDEDGNVDIVSSTFSITNITTRGPIKDPDETPTTSTNGFLFNSTEDVCPPQNLLLTYVKHGRCDVGETEEVLPLPLDAFIEAEKPYYADKNCGCDLSSSSSSGRSSSSSETIISSYSSPSSSSTSESSDSSENVGSSWSSASSTSESSLSSIIIHSSSSATSRSSMSSILLKSSSSRSSETSSSSIIVRSSSSESSSMVIHSSSSPSSASSPSSPSSLSSPSSETGSDQSGIIVPKYCWWGYRGTYDCETKEGTVEYWAPEGPIGEVSQCNPIPVAPPDQWLYWEEGPGPTKCTFLYVKGGSPSCSFFNEDCTGTPEDPIWEAYQVWMQFCSCWAPKNCHFQFTVDYDCVTDTFGTVTLLSQVCSEEECIPYDWVLASQTATTCTFIKTMCFNNTGTEGCGVDSDCDIHFPGVPDDPTNLAGCDCAVKGACCTAGGHCDETTELRCAGLNGYYMGQGLVCTPNPCNETCIEDCPPAGLLEYTGDSPEGCKNSLDCSIECPFGSIPCDIGPTKRAWYISPEDPDNAWGCDCCCTPVANACSEFGDCGTIDEGVAYPTLQEAWEYVREECTRLCYNNFDFDPESGCQIAHAPCEGGEGFVTYLGGVYYAKCCCENEPMDPQPPVVKVVNRWSSHGGQYGPYCCLSCCMDIPSGCETELGWIIDRAPYGPTCGGTRGYTENFFCERDWGRTETCNHGCVLYSAWASWSMLTGDEYETCTECQASI